MPLFQDLPKGIQENMAGRIGAYEAANAKQGEQERTMLSRPKPHRQWATQAGMLPCTSTKAEAAHKKKDEQRQKLYDLTYTWNLRKPKSQKQLIGGCQGSAGRRNE